MTGAIDVRDRFLFIGHSDSRGHVHVYDLGRERVTRSFHFAPEECGEIAGIAVDVGWNLHVADRPRHAVRRFTIFGRETLRFGTPTVGGGGDRRGVLESPNDVALDEEGSLYVACGAMPLVHAVQKFAPDGRCLGTFRAFGEPNEKFASPRGIAVAGDRVFVADTEAGCVQVFTTAGVFVSMFSTATRPGERSFPTAVAPRPEGGLLVAQRGEEPCVKAFEGGEEFERVWIEGGEGEGRVDDPEDLVCDGRGFVYVSDRRGERVQGFDASGRFLGVLLDVENLPA